MVHDNAWGAGLVVRYVGLQNRGVCRISVGREPEPCCAVSGIALAPSRCVDQVQLRARPMTNELKIARQRAKKLIRLRAKKVISLKAARKLLPGRQKAGA